MTTGLIFSSRRLMDAMLRYSNDEVCSSYLSTAFRIVAKRLNSLEHLQLEKIFFCSYFTDPHDGRPAPQCYLDHQPRPSVPVE